MEDILLKSTNPSQRVKKLIEDQYRELPEIESERAIILTNSYKETENEPIILRRALAFYKILENISIVIREGELIVGSLTKKPRGAQVFPEFSSKWIEEEFNFFDKRKGDIFTISDDTKKELSEIFKYWDGKSVNELARSYMTDETLEAMQANVFTVNNYFFNGIGHISVNYEKMLRCGAQGIILEAAQELASLDKTSPEYAKNKTFLEAVIISNKAIILFAQRFSKYAYELAMKENDIKRKEELLSIAKVCENVPRKPANSFYEAIQSFWFIHMVIQIESNGHSISPMRFDQYMYPYYKKDLNRGKITREFAQELVDCLFIKLNEINKVRDKESTKAFGGYPMFQNLIVGGQTKEGIDATNELSFICLEATNHTRLSQPSISIRVWEKSNEKLLLKAAKISKIGTGMPAYYNDKIIIPSMLKRGISLKDARDYGIIGCVEPQKGGSTEGWHDSAFVNLARVLESVIYNKKLDDKVFDISSKDFEDIVTTKELIETYKAHMNYYVSLLVNAENSIDIAHRERAPLPFLSSLIDNCISVKKSVQEGGAKYNFTGPQGVGVANVGDSFAAIDKLVFKDKRFSIKELKYYIENNFYADFTKEDLYSLVAKEIEAKKEINIDMKKIVSKITKIKEGEKIRQLLLNKAEKYGNDIDEIDFFTREAAMIYCTEVEKYKNPRGGIFQPGLYPASINVAMGSVVSATPDGRKAYEPLADGVSPSPGADKKGPTAVFRSVAKLNHEIASNGTLLNQKFHPAVLEREKGLYNLVNLVKGYFEEDGMHVQFNVIDRETLLEAKKNPEKYRNLVVRVAGYSAQFISLDPGVQDDIINRTEQG
ncbi:MAG: glycyl radical protein [Sarcina sp.]